MKIINFMGMRRQCGILSVILVLASLAIIITKGVERNVDFAGGTQLTVSFKDGDLNISTLRDRVSAVDEKASIVKVRSAAATEKHTSEFTVKIKNPDVEEGSESETSLARLNALEAAFAEVDDESGEIIELLKKKPQDQLAERLIQENPYNLTTTDSERARTYRDLASKIKSAVESSDSLVGLAQAADPENHTILANQISLIFPAINRTTQDLLGAILRKTDPLNRGISGDYSDIAEQVAKLRSDNNDFLPSFDTLKDGLTLGEGEDLDALIGFLKENFTLGAYKILSNATFSPSIASELLGKAWVAIIMALLGILLYVAARFSSGYGLAAVVALAHDVIIALGFFSLAGAELSNPVVAAFLTIVGYSLNDTIVVFDRIRDNLKAAKRPDVEQTMNVSINQTLSRTVVTSLTTFFVVAVIFFASNATLRDFAFPLLIGIVVGTYSSIFVASPTLLTWNNRVKKIAG